MSICEHNLELLSDFLDGTLDAARSVNLSKHLDTCSYCRAEYHALRNTVGMLESARVPDGTHLQRQALINLRNAVVAPALPRRSLAGFRLAAATFAAAALAAITIQLGPRSPIDVSNVPPSLVAEATGAHSLPTAFDLDEMASLHAVHSFAVAAGDAGDQQETLADATSRLH
jgi:anti-sigma factor RsiW